MSSESFRYATPENEINTSSYCWICQYPAYEALYHGPCSLMVCGKCFIEGGNCHPPDHPCLYKSHKDAWYPVEENKMMKSFFERLTVFCPNQSLGCNATVLRSEYATHLAQCAFKELKCIQCKKIVPQGEMQDHLKSLCLQRSATCSICQVTGPY